MENEYGWIDNVPDFPVFLGELTAFALKSPDGARSWAQSQWASRGNSRGQARDLVEFVEQSAEGRALVAAWRFIAEAAAGVGDPAKLVADLRAAGHTPGLTDAVWHRLMDQAVLDDPAVQEGLAQVRRGEGVSLAEYLAGDASEEV